MKLTRQEAEDLVFDVVSKVSGFEPEVLRNSLDKDLVADWGLESYQMIEIWSLLDEQLGLEIGEAHLKEPGSLRALIRFAISSANVDSA
jgi:acyl carrier protein